MHWDRRACLAVTALVGVGWACTSDPAANDGASETDDAEDDSGEGEEGSDTSVSGAPAASGIRIVDVYANQGVEIPIWDAAGWVGGEQRNAPLIPGRRTLVRATWALDDGWEAREVEARLSIVDPEGVETLDPSLIEVVEEPNLDELTGTFAWLIEPPEAVAGLRFSVELFEADPLYFGDPPAESPRIPEQGSVLVGFEPEPRQLEVVVVPIPSTVGCTDMPDVEALLEDYQTWLDQVLPTSSVVLTVREPWGWPVESGNPVSLVEQLSSLRDEDGSEAFYWGVIHGCTNPSVNSQASPGGWAAFGVWDENGTNADRRDGMWWGVGAGVGLPNVACPRAPQGNGQPDMDYPYRDGLIGGYGFDIVNQQLVLPGFTHSFMSNCQPDWVSDYEWEQLHTLMTPR